MSEFIAVLIATVIICVICFVPVYLIKQATCERQAASFEDHEFYVFGGCMVKHKGRWIPLDNIRGFDDKG